MWNDRYSTPDYVFGTEPAGFLREQEGKLPKSARVLSVADGEGRNSVWLAGQGHELTAFDMSDVALGKARALARERGVEVAFHHADILTWDWTAASYDAVVGVFIQFMGPGERAQVFDGMKASVRPGGLILLHGYTPRQLAYGTGGPGRAENLYTPGLLRDAFGDFDILRLVEYDREIDEGRGHSGMSALIDLVARRPR